MTFPIWRLTRTGVGRWLFDVLGSVGIRASRLEQYEHGLDDMPAVSPPNGVSIQVTPPDAVELSGRMDRPELTAKDRVVAAAVDDEIVGVQHVSPDRSFHVDPLDRPIRFDGAYFWGLYVTEAWRRRGVATALLDRALRYVAEETDVTRVQTLIGADNVPSKHVLGNAGFDRRGTRSYYRVFGFEHRSSRGV